MTVTPSSHAAAGLLLTARIRPIHPFPARMAPSIVGKVLESLGSRPMRVLDSMAGSGTTLVAARLLGHEAIGFDSDPMAVLLGRAWLADTDSRAIGAAAVLVLAAARKTFKALRVRDAYPNGADKETRQYVRYWFDPLARRQLTALANNIASVEPARTRDTLWCAFSRMIIVKQAGVSLAADAAHSRPHRVYDRAPVRPFELFERSVAQICKNHAFNDGKTRPLGSVRLGDARALRVADQTIDVAVTSPPYLNAIDYLRGHRLALVWMGHSMASLRKIRSVNVGTERTCAVTGLPRHIEAAIDASGVPKKVNRWVRGMLARYIADMDRVIGEFARVLKPTGHLVLVLGDSTLNGHYIRNSAAITALGQHHGFVLTQRRARRLPGNRRYLAPPGSTAPDSPMATRMRTEVVLTFTNGVGGASRRAGASTRKRTR
jgi:hypothetical protein